MRPGISAHGRHIGQDQAGSSCHHRCYLPTCIKPMRRCGGTQSLIQGSHIRCAADRAHRLGPIPHRWWTASAWRVGAGNGCLAAWHICCPPGSVVQRQTPSRSRSRAENRRTELGGAGEAPLAEPGARLLHEGTPNPGAAGRGSTPAGGVLGQHAFTQRPMAAVCPHCSRGCARPDCRAGSTFCSGGCSAWSANLRNSVAGCVPPPSKPDR